MLPSRSVGWSIVTGLTLFAIITLGSAVQRDRAEIRFIEALVAGRKAEALKAARTRIKDLINQASVQSAAKRQARSWGRALLHARGQE